MTPTDSARLVQLPEDDRVRMARLYEEVTPRLIEMALIVSRVLSLSPAEHAPLFTARQPSDRRMANMVIEPNVPVRLLADATGTSTGCYIYSDGAVLLCGRPD